MSPPFIPPVSSYHYNMTNDTSKIKSSLWHYTEWTLAMTGHTQQQVNEWIKHTHTLTFLHTPWFYKWHMSLESGYISSISCGSCYARTNIKKASDGDSSGGVSSTQHTTTFSVPVCTRVGISQHSSNIQKKVTYPQKSRFSSATSYKRRVLVDTRCF